MRKLVAIGLALLFVLSFGATGYAGDWNGAFVSPAFTDIAGHEAETALTILAALGIYSGETGVGGPLRPDDLITRAQFCKVVMVAVGREKTAQGMKGLRPEFTDEIPAWAWGYVNAAVYSGVINGYGDGTFRPGAPVTYAEACAMLVRAVPGHLPQVPNYQWPYNFLFYASDNGFTGAVDVGAANLPATRGDIARMTLATMAVPRLNKDGVKIAGTEILTERYFEGYLAGYGLTSGQVSIAEHPQDANAQAFDLASKVFLLGARSLEGLRNLRVALVLDSRESAGGKVVYAGPVEDARSLTGIYEKLETPSSGSYDYLVFTGGVKVPLERGKIGALDLTLNNDPGLHADRLARGDLCTVALNERGLVVHVAAFRENLGKWYVTSLAPGSPADSVFVSVARTGEKQGYTIGKSSGVTLNGRPATPGSLAVDDVLYLASYGADPEGEIIAARAVRSVVEGEVRDNRTVYSAAGHQHYCTLRLANGTTKEYRVDHGGNLPQPPWVVGSRGRYGLDADGALFVGLGYHVPTYYVLVTSYVSGSENYLTVDQRGQVATYLVKKASDGRLFDFAGIVGQLGRLEVDPVDNRAYGFVRADFTGSPWYDVLAVDAARDALTLKNLRTGAVEFVPEPVVYRYDASSGLYAYLPLASLPATWDLRRDQTEGSSLFLYHPPTATVAFALPGGRPTAGTEFSLNVTVRIQDDGAVPGTTLLRYRAVLTEHGQPVANQAVRYLEPGQTWDAPSSLTTDASGEVFFGPAGGFRLEDLPALLQSAGVTTEFRSILPEGNYTLVLSVVDVTAGNNYPLGSATFVFGVS